MKILVNKTINNSYMKEMIEKPFESPANQYTLKFYTDAVQGTTTGTGATPHMLFTGSSLLDIIDGLNEASWNGTLDLGEGYEFDTVISTLFCSTAAYRESMVDYLVTKGYATTEQSDQIKAITTSFIGYNPSNIVKSYDEVEDIYTFDYNTPIELKNHYTAAENITGERLYLVMVMMTSTSHSGTTGNAGGAITTLFHNPTLEQNVEQSSYIASDLGDTFDTEANPDLKYDHLDQIDYIDSFRFRFKLPRTIV
jgi:hypothetical protein